MGEIKEPKPGEEGYVDKDSEEGGDLSLPRFMEEQEPKIESVHETTHKKNLEAFPDVLRNISQNTVEIEQLLKQDIPFNPEDPHAIGNIGRKVVEARDQLSSALADLKELAR